MTEKIIRISLRLRLRSGRRKRLFFIAATAAKNIGPQFPGANAMLTPVEQFRLLGRRLKGRLPKFFSRHSHCEDLTPANFVPKSGRHAVAATAVPQLYLDVTVRMQYYYSTMQEINWPALILACLLIGGGVRSAWRRAAFRLVFPGAGDRAGKVAVVWFRAKFQDYGGVHCWLWLPRWLSRRLWIVRSTGSGRLARWLRRQDD